MENINKISNYEIKQVLDYTANRLYSYFEKNLNPRLKFDSDKYQLEEDKKRQSEIYLLIDQLRESLENK